MDIYIYPITAAVAIFPLLSVIFTLPYVINQYHKYGALLILRIILVYSFIFYMMASYFMTILPLPPIDTVQDSGTYMLLVPFSAVRIWWNNCGFILNNPSTYWPALLNYDFFQILFNILLLVPFGVYLRYYFERKWYQVIFLSFAYSLFFELTQLSGLYGIYPHAYRWFEIDDLICNTLGGLIGFLVTPLCSFFLPSRDKLDEMSYHKGERVSILRRGLANIIDWIMVVVLVLVINKYVLSIWSISTFKGIFVIIAFFIYFVVISWVMSGKTIGKYIVSVRVKSDNRKKPKLYQYLIRYGILYLLVLPTPFYIQIFLQLFTETQNIWIKVAYCIVMLMLVTISIYIVVNAFIGILLHRLQTVYEKISHTQLVSTVVKELDEDAILDDLEGENKDGNSKNEAAITEENEDE